MDIKVPAQGLTQRDSTWKEAIVFSFSVFLNSPLQQTSYADDYDTPATATTTTFMYAKTH